MYVNKLIIYIIWTIKNNNKRINFIFTLYHYLMITYYVTMFTSRQEQERMLVIDSVKNVKVKSGLDIRNKDIYCIVFWNKVRFIADYILFFFFCSILFFSLFFFFLSFSLSLFLSFFLSFSFSFMIQNFKKTVLFIYLFNCKGWSWSN